MDRTRLGRPGPTRGRPVHFQTKERDGNHADEKQRYRRDAGDDIRADVGVDFGADVGVDVGADLRVRPADVRPNTGGDTQVAPYQDVPGCQAIHLGAGNMMANDQNAHHRRSIRLPGYDYAQAGAYFVTLCTQGRECLFGDVTPDGDVTLNDAGQMIERWWHELGRKFPNVVTDAFVIMPNHVHGIITIVARDAAGMDQGAHANRGAHAGAPLPDVPDVGPVPVPEIVQWFKTMTTNEYIRGVKTAGWLPFPGRLWQRNYYEHIIRDDAGLDLIRHYIDVNPPRWALDLDNPATWTPTGKMP